MACSVLRRPAFALIGFLFVAVSTNPASAAQHVVIGDVSTRDSVRPVYDVTMPPLGSTGGGLDTLKLGGGEIVGVTTARGQKLLCGVPPPPGDREDEEVEGGGWDFEGVEELMDGYRGKCFRRKEGWWDFVFCYGVSVEQNHASIGENDLSVNYVLGKLDPEFDEERRKSGGAGGSRKPGGDVVTGNSDEGGKGNGNKASEGTVDIDAPYTQLFGNGTLCDITGKPREILVKYKCNREATMLGGTSVKAVQGMEFISPLREVETCIYEIDFVNAAICNHPAYKSKIDKNKLEIQCIMQNEEEAFLGLASTVYRKASINL